MKNIEKSNVITAIICAVALSTVSFHTGAAAGNQVAYNSQGKIMFDNNTEDTADDVVFDASDFRTISDMVIAGKKQIGTELNKYPSVNFNMTKVPDFSELASAIDTLTNDATAGNNMILKDYTAYAKGNKIKGTIPSKEAAAYTPGRSDQTIAAGQYLSGAQTIKGDQNLTAANIISGKTIFGVQGSAQAESHTIEANKSVNITSTSGSITPSSGNNAMSAVTYSVSGIDASKIISGQSILGVAGSAAQESHTEMSRSFSQSEMASADITLESGKEITIPANQYLADSITINSDTSGNVKQENIKLESFDGSMHPNKGDKNVVTSNDNNAYCFVKGTATIVVSIDQPKSLKYIESYQPSISESAGTGGCSTFAIYGSNDNSSWEEIPTWVACERTTETYWYDRDVAVHVVRNGDGNYNAKGYKYYKLIMNSAREFTCIAALTLKFLFAHSEYIRFCFCTLY